MDYSELKKQWDNGRDISKRCSRCKYGALVEANYQKPPKYFLKAKCHHRDHPGIVGGLGTEWALNCAHFIDTGFVGEIKSVIFRNGKIEEPSCEEIK